MNKEWNRFPFCSNHQRLDSKLKPQVSFWYEFRALLQKHFQAELQQLKGSGIPSKKAFIFSCFRQFHTVQLPVQNIHRAGTSGGLSYSTEQWGLRNWIIAQSVTGDANSTEDSRAILYPPTQLTGLVGPWQLDSCSKLNRYWGLTCSVPLENKM